LTTPTSFLLLKKVKMLKTFSKCGVEYPATLEFFYRNLRHRDKLTSACKRCQALRMKQYHQTEGAKQIKRKREEKYRQTPKGKEILRRASEKYRRTLRGRLRNIYTNINYRCNNSKFKQYQDYGGRGIKNKFKSFEDFFDCVRNCLGITAFEQIENLEIDRIDNSGNYERGNIRFVTHKENCNNRKKRK